MLNVLPVTSASRQPRGIVKLGPAGALKIVPGWDSWSVGNNSYYEADTFRICFSTSKLPASNDANWFSNQTQIFVEILAGIPQDPANPQVSELTSLIYGRVDHMAFDPKTRQIVLTGRDLTAAFIDHRISTTYTNQKAAQIVTQLAQSHGLDVTNVTPTTAMVGTAVNGSYALQTSNSGEWDLIASLARDEGFVVFVQGQSIFFGPDPRPTGASNPYVIQWKPPTAANGSPVSNVADIEFGRDLTVAHGIIVTARSPNRRTGRPVTASYPVAPKSITPGNATPFGQSQPYSYLMAADKTPAQVAAFAQKAYQNLISHEMKLRASLPADDLLTVSTTISVQGTGTEWDQIYFPHLITREMGVEDGYRMTVEAQNTSPAENPDM